MTFDAYCEKKGIKVPKPVAEAARFLESQGFVYLKDFRICDAVETAGMTIIEIEEERNAQ